MYFFFFYNCFLKLFRFQKGRKDIHYLFTHVWYENSVLLISEQVLAEEVLGDCLSLMEDKFIYRF